jgi:serine/threonine protein kinase
MSTLPVGSEFGNYHIVRHIGGGGMAQIYQAKTKGLAGFEKHLALKVINPEYANEQRFIQMLIDEAKITVGLSHVNIAQVFDLGQCNGIYYIAMEFVDGLDVLELVNGLHGMGRRLPIEAVAYIGRQICSGLHYAHTRKDANGKPLNIVHRDISPQNILVSRAGEIKVVDFGIAKAAGMSSKTQAGVIKGKVNYMAPEQVMGQKANRRTDIFSVGVVVWESLTSQMVYSADNMGELVAAVRKADIPPPSSVRPEIPAGLDQVVLKALNPNTKERFQSAHQAQVELTKFLSTYAPDYSGSNLAALVDEVLGRKGRAEEAEAELDEGDLLGEELQDHNSLIFSAAFEAQLIVVSEEGEEIHTIGEGLTLGRAGQLAIADARVSRQHARVAQRDGAYIVEDLGSSNGTYVNDQRLTAPHTLRPGDQIRIGGCHLRFVAPGDEDVPTGTAAPREPVYKLIVQQGERRYERVLDGDTPLSYQLQVGSVLLEGSSGRVMLKDDGYWLEPARSRLAVKVQGKRTTRPVRLSAGDSFEIDDITFTYSEE